MTFKHDFSNIALGELSELLVFRVGQNSGIQDSD